MGLDYIPHQGRSFLGVTKLFVTSGARSNKQTNKARKLYMIPFTLLPIRRFWPQFNYIPLLLRE